MPVPRSVSLLGGPRFRSRLQQVALTSGGRLGPWRAFPWQPTEQPLRRHADSPAAHGPTAQRTPARHSAPPCTVLIVEDHPEISTTLTELLEDEGYQVVTAVNGQEALTYLRHAPQPPSLILLDLMMPVMDGWTFRTLQAGDPALAAIPVVVMSAISNVRYQQFPIAAAAYLPKPLNFHLLLQTVARFCVPDAPGESR